MGQSVTVARVERVQSGPFSVRGPRVRSGTQRGVRGGVVASPWVRGGAAVIPRLRRLSSLCPKEACSERGAAPQRRASQDDLARRAPPASEQEDECE